MGRLPTVKKIQVVSDVWGRDIRRERPNPNAIRQALLGCRLDGVINRITEGALELFRMTLLGRKVVLQACDPAEQKKG